MSAEPTEPAPFDPEQTMRWRGLVQRAAEQGNRLGLDGLQAFCLTDADGKSEWSARNNPAPAPSSMSDIEADIETVHGMATTLLYRWRDMLLDMQAQRDHWRELYEAELAAVVHIHLRRKMPPGEG